MDSFSRKLTRFRRYIVARQQTLPYKPQNRTYCHVTFILPGSRQYGRAKTAVDRRKGERAGIGYSKPCQNIYARPLLNHYWIWKQKEKQVKARLRKSSQSTDFVKTRRWNSGLWVILALRLKYLKPEGTKQKLEESCSRVVFASLIPSKLTQIWRTSCLRIAWRILRMHDRKLNGCRQRLLFASQLIPRKCSLCSKGSENENWYGISFLFLC